MRKTVRVCIASLGQFNSSTVPVWIPAGGKQMMSVGLVASARCLPISARVTSNTPVLAQARETE